MKKEKIKIEPYKVILWDVNRDKVEYYDIMPYLVECWEEEETRERKIWCFDYEDKTDDTRMPETFEEYKQFVIKWCHYQFWSRCQYEILVNGFPPRMPKVTMEEEYKFKDGWDDIEPDGEAYRKYLQNYSDHQIYKMKDEKIDAYNQVIANIDVVTNHFKNGIELARKGNK